VRIGVLTGGGDCPGLNPALRGLVYRATGRGHQVLGFLDGWKGLLDGRHRPLAREDLIEAMGHGGTLLGSSRTNPFKREEDASRLLTTLDTLQVDALVAMGGDDTLSAALELHWRGRRVVGVPKTMDNDLRGTDWTFGFDSASSVSMEALERLRDTARSHHRIIVLEVMGRHAGWVALATGLGGGADYTVLPEEPFDAERLCAAARRAVEARGYALVVASEGAAVPSGAKGAVGAKDDFGHELLKDRGVGAALAGLLERRLGVEARSAVIGHVQRGGPPTLFDRILSTRLGVKAADLIEEGKFGQVAVLRGERIASLPLEEAVSSPRRVDPPWLDLLHTFDA
jgi:phosphofructokinase-like protein